MVKSRRGQLFILALITTVLVTLIAGCFPRNPIVNPPVTPVPSTAPAPPPPEELLEPPPAAYQPLYTELQAELAHFEIVLDQRWDGSHGQTIWATELAYANGNIGEVLLDADSMARNRLLLDRLQAMGIKGVVLAVKYPLLKPDYPRSDEYLQFFKNIVAECHSRDIKVLVECGVVFAGTSYSSIQYDWSGYTTATLLQGVQDELVVIAREIKPDYLTLANEPTTEENLTGLEISPAVWSDFISSTITKIGGSSGILLGAGTGTWENPAYINTLYGMPGLDYIDLHIYPLNEDGLYLTRALNAAMGAHNAGQRVTVSESWLYKASARELSTGILDFETAISRDVYSFWYPLDARFIRDIMDLGDAFKMDFVSFFWTRSFFAGLDYNRTPHNLTTLQYNRLINQAFIRGVDEDTLSSLGRDFQEQISSRAGQ